MCRTDRWLTQVTLESDGYLFSVGVSRDDNTAGVSDVLVYLISNSMMCLKFVFAVSQQLVTI